MAPMLGVTPMLTIGSFRIHKGVTFALSNISLRGTRVSALVIGFGAIAANTLPV